MNADNLDAFTRAYIECALWSSTDNSREDGGDPLRDNYGPDDLAPETLARMAEDCADFRDCDEWRAAESDGWWDDANGGHDFWLTRNGHGAGFWDRYSDDEGSALGVALTDRAKLYGEVYLYVGDDGRIYL